jgi:hypothetical protein
VESDECDSDGAPASESDSDTEWLHRGRPKARVCTQPQAVPVPDPEPQPQPEAGPQASKGKGKGKGKGTKRVRSEEPEPGDVSAGPATPAHPAPPRPVVRSPLEGVPSVFTSIQQQTAEGLRVGASICLRAHIAAAGTRRKNGTPFAITPLPGMTPSSIVLTRHGVMPLLQRAVELGTGRATRGDAVGDVAAADGARAAVGAVQLLLTRLRESPEQAASLGVTPLFNVTHPPLAQLLHKHETSTVRGQVVYTTGGVRLCFPCVRYVRRMEARGAQVKAGRLFNWNPRGTRWLRPAGKRGVNGAGVRTLSRDRQGWRCWTPGAYHPEGVAKKWQPSWDDAHCVIIDPGVLLPLCTSDGRALTKAEWYRARSIWLDFVPKCSDVQDKVDALRQRDLPPCLAPSPLPSSCPLGGCQCSGPPPLALPSACTLR